MVLSYSLYNENDLNEKITYSTPNNRNIIFSSIITKRMSMELRHLRYFLAVERERHFGRAAQALHIVQSALSMQISALEEELGGKLFRRTSRKVELTEAGELFKIEAINTLAQAQKAKDIVQNSFKGVTGSIRIGYVSNAVISNALTTHLKQFHQKHPEVELILNEIEPYSQTEQILKNKIDIAYTPDAQLSEDLALSQKPVGQWPLMIALSNDHPFAQLDTIHLEQIIDQPLITYPQHEIFLKLEQHFNQKPNIAHQGSSVLTILALVASNLGIAIVPKSLTTLSIPNLEFRPITGNPLKTELSCIHRQQETNGAVNAYLTML